MRLRNKSLTLKVTPINLSLNLRPLIYREFSEEAIFIFSLCTEFLSTPKPIKQLTSALQQTLTTLIEIVGSVIAGQTLYIHKYLSMTSNVWNDGFLFDFLQKKTMDAWVRRFVIYTGFVFSERLVFDTVYRVYIDFLLKPLSANSIFETANVAELLLVTLFTYATLLLGVTLLLI